MAYNSTNLSALSYANGFTLWHYKTDDHVDTVELSYYFDKAAGMLRVGDFILVNGGEDHSIMVVWKNADGHVYTSTVGTTAGAWG